MKPLHHGPNNRQTTGFRGKGVNLISTPSDIAKQTFNRVGASDIPMHDLWEGIKRQEMLFIFTQAAHRFWIAPVVFGFEGRHFDQCLLLCRLFPDPSQFGGDGVLLTLGDGIDDIVYEVLTSSVGQSPHIVVNKAVHC
jgi:hypothetical protein